MKPLEYVYPRVDRAAYKTQTGAQAEPFDPAQAPKFWFAKLTEPTLFPVPDSASPNGFKQRIFGVAEAAKVNLPGPYEYTPTPYTMPTPWYAVPDADVHELASLLGGTAIIGSSVGVGTAITWPEIKVGDVSIRAYLLVPRWYALGKNRRGTWFLQDGALFFHPAIETIQPTTPHEDSQIPIKLADGEKVIFGSSGGMGAPVVATASDVTAAAGGSSAGGGLTPQDRALAVSTNDGIQQILSILLGGPK